MHRPRQSSRRPSTLAALAGLASVVALVGACGAAEDAAPVAEPAPAVSVPGDLTMGGDDGGDTTRSAAATEEEGAGSESSAEPSETPSPDAEGDGEDEAAEVDAERCAALQEAWSSTNRALVQVDASAGHPRTLVESFRAGHRAMASAEPTEGVAAPWGTMSDYLGDAVAAFEDVDEDDADAVSSAMAGAITAEDTAEAAAAGQEVTEYLTTTCSAR